MFFGPLLLVFLFISSPFCSVSAFGPCLPQLPSAPCMPPPAAPCMPQLPPPLPMPCPPPPPALPCMPMMPQPQAAPCPCPPQMMPQQQSFPYYQQQQQQSYYQRAFPQQQNQFAGYQNSYQTGNRFLMMQQQPQPQQTIYSLPSSATSYQVGPVVPLPVPIPAREKYPPEMMAKKAEESVKDPFEKENKEGGSTRLFARDEPAKYALPSVLLQQQQQPQQIVYPTSNRVMVQQQQQPQLTSQPEQVYPPYPYPQPYPGQNPCVPMPMPVMPQLPVQNCCLGCAPRQCRKSRKAMGSKTVTGLSNKNNVTGSGSVEWDEAEGDEDKKGTESQRCNDAELRKILQECAPLTMVAAKEIILERAEHPQKMATEELRRPPRAVHVFCAPRDLEYVARTDQFCAGDVADGICFAFRTRI